MSATTLSHFAPPARKLAAYMLHDNLTPYAKGAHLKAARTVCDALSIGDQDTFAGLSVILGTKLTQLTHRALARAALRACDVEEVTLVVEAVIPPQSGAGWPVTPLEGVAEEATFWADYASSEELRAYAAVCLSRLSQAPGRAA